jgi:WD40 repeat protein
LEKRLRAGHEDFVNSAVFSLDGSMVVTASRDKTAKLWKYNSANEEWEVDKVFRGHTASVHTAVFSPDGKWVLTASEDKTARIWDVATGKELPFSPLKKQDQDVFSHEQAVLCAAYSRDGKWIITGSEDNTARLWDATTGRPVKITGPTPGEQRDLILAGHSAGVTSVALSEDRKRAITGSRDLMARLWELEQGETLVTLKGHTEEVTCVTFSPDGKSILTAGRDKRLILWPAVDWRTPFGESGSLSGQTLGRIFGGTGAGNGRWAPVRVASDEGPIDLLKCLDLKSDAVQGKWQLEQGLLVSPKTYGARIQMPVVPPDEFKVTLVAERKEGENGLIMGLMAGGNQFIATLDFQEPGKGPVSALEDVDGKRVTLNDTTFYGKALAESGPSTIVYTVRKDHITVECNGKTVIDFKGDPSRLSLNKYWKVPNQECLFLGTYDCTYVIHKLELTPLSGKEGQPPETTPPTTPEGPLAEPPSEKPGEATPAPSGELLPAIPNDTPASGAPASPPREIKPTASEKRDSDAKL